MVEAWDPAGTDNFRAEFLGEPTDDSLTDIITGIGELSRGELAGERMTVAYEERDQENEHSCFSDNTTADLVANQQGIINVWAGTYPGAAEGPGLVDLVADVDQELADATTASMEASLDAITSIEAPFDQHLADGVSDDTPGRTAILTATEALSTQTDDLVKAATALGLSIEVT
jgi:putative iron-regulated protein